MDIAYVSTFAALGGSVVGGLISGTATWLAQWAQVQASHRAHQISHREELFRDFIIAASKAYGQALLSDQPDVQELSSIYGMVNRMEVLCSPRTTACAQEVVDITLDTYFQPNRTFKDIHEMMKTGNGLHPLSEFAKEARAELQSLAGK
jgi:hypothetical protein